MCSSQHKRHQAKKVNPERLPKNNSFKSNSDDNADVDNDTADFISSSPQMTPSETLQPQGEQTTDVKGDTETYREIPIDTTIQSTDGSIEDKMSRTDLILDSDQGSTSGNNGVVKRFTAETTDDANFGGPLIFEVLTL